MDPTAESDEIHRALAENRHLADTIRALRDELEVRRYEQD